MMYDDECGAVDGMRIGRGFCLSRILSFKFSLKLPGVLRYAKSGRGH
jgi:hypothetical protein